MDTTDLKLDFEVQEIENFWGPQKYITISLYADGDFKSSIDIDKNDLLEVLGLV